MVELSQYGRILLLDILEILQKHSDEKHRIKQIDIIKYLEQDHGYENLYPKRKTIKNNMEKLLKHVESTNQDNIFFETSTRLTSSAKNSKKDSNSVEYTDFGYRHEFTSAELYLIIDSIIFSKQIPSNQRKEVIKKLEGLSSKHFNSRVAHISPLPNKKLINHELFWNIEVLDEAISKRKQVVFHYHTYNLDEKSQLTLDTRKDENGITRDYVINPYQMVPASGHYYLICNNDKFDNLSHYRLDRITNIKLLDTKQKLLKKIKGKEHGLDLANYVAEHIYMYSGESAFVSLRFKNWLLSDFVDWFGTENVSFSNQTEEEITARIKVNKEAMRKWALQYALHARVLSPDDLVEDIKKDIEQASLNYK